MAGRRGWRNWTGNQRCWPARVVHVGGVGDVVRAVRAAGRDGLPVRVAGSGHSFTAAAVTNGVLLRMDRMDRVRDIDPATGLATVEAGMPVHRLSAHLAAAGLALTNVGDIDAQTIAGAISTSTHGTGRDSAGMAAQVRALELVLADGTVLSCSADHRPDLLDAARVSLGALGVITAVTVQAEPAFLLRAVEQPMDLDTVLDRLDELTAVNEHVEFFWFPHTRWVLTKRNNRVPGPACPLPPVRAWADDVLVSNHLFGLLCRLGWLAPPVIPRVNRLAGVLLPGREYVDHSHRVFSTTRRVRFLEMEYALPRESVVDVLRALRAAVERSRWRISFPVEVRVAPADEPWLSTAQGRASAYVAVHQYPGSGLAEYFATAERIFVTAGGRPHWGKLHTRNAGHLAEVYPWYGAFLARRDELDPGRRFVNEYVTRLFGH